ncbi:MAG TPA: tRNA (N6-threonylcarbamoyladenosine(37)-N6)-methyltransferase TrmO [Thermoanaerobaculia bacterium]|nr:tRNA (N6-threonylcarbamoyladenosine(37)-N6)-methyltransferase TrmO [Thermoanaerobaculia bacterium]
MDDAPRPIGWIRSPLTSRKGAPRQGSDGAPDAWLEIEPEFEPALLGLAVGDEVVLLTWLHEARRNVLQVRPRSDPDRTLTGVFATRSPDRPNPIGLHPVRVLEIEGTRLRVGPLEAIDGTPVLDVKPRRFAGPDPPA